MTRAFHIVSRSRKRLTFFGALVVLAVSASAAIAYFTSTGAGTGAASTGSLSAATISAPSTSTASITITWTQQAALLPSGPNSGITYTVERKLGAGSFSPVGSGPCSGSLPYGTSSCTDTVAANGTYTYEAIATFNGWTAASNQVSTTATVDTTPPTSSITFPTAGAFYNVSGYNAGCSTSSTGDVCGTASDNVGGTGLNKVQVAIQRSSDSDYWNGTVWVGGIVWNDATGTANWSYALDAIDLNNGVSYTVQSRAIDNANNTQTTPDSKTFTFDTTAPTVTTINRAGTSPTNTGPLAFTVTFSEPVNTSAVVAGLFTVTTSNVSGGPPTVGTITPISPSGGFATSYTVNVNTNGATGTNSGSVRLDQTGDGSVVDRAGNALTGTHTGDQSYTYDTTAPTLTSINRVGTNPADVGPLTWTVTFSEPVNGVTTSNFSLTTSGTGGTAPTITSATASGGAPSATWTVSVSTTGTTGTNAGSIGLNLANNTGVTDASTNALATATFTGQAYSYDTTAPTVSSVGTTKATGSYKAGVSIPVTVTFSEPVTVTGTPKLALNTSPAQSASYTSGSGTSTLTFTYTIASSDNAARLDYASTSSLTLNGGTITDTATNNAVLTLPATQGANDNLYTTNIVVDTTAPTVSSVGTTKATGSYKAGVSIPVTVTFSEPVTVTGTPKLALNTSPAQSASYTSGSGTSTLTFTYTIASSDNAARLDYASTSSLTLNGGTITDTATNNAVLTLPATQGANDNLYATNIVVDTTAPTASSIDTTNGTTAGTIDTNDTIAFTFSEAMDPSSILSGFTGASTAVKVCVTGGSPNVLTVVTGSCSSPTAVNLGTVALGTSGYVSANGFGAQWPATMALNAAKTVLTITLTGGCEATGNSTCGSKTGGVPAATTFTWNPSSSATDVAGNPMTTTARNSTSKEHF